MKKNIAFDSLTGVIFGRNCVSQLGRILKERKKTRPFVITDRGILEAGVVEIVLETLEKADLEYRIFTEVETNPLSSVIEGALEIIIEFSPDIIIAIGGGSVIDTAKAAAFHYANPGLEILQIEGLIPAGYNSFPVITIPTTAGTGSEVTSWSVITDPLESKKVSFGGDCMAPELAVIDPMLTITLPAQLTLWTGIDALTHALEAYLSTAADTYIEDQSYLATRYIIENLPRAIANGENITAREGLMLGSYMAGWAMQNAGLGLIHGMSHQVSAFYHTHHGLTNAHLLIPVLEYNSFSAPRKMEALSALVPGKGDLIEKIDSYLDNLGLETEIKIKKNDISELSRRAYENVNSKTNPGQPTREEIGSLFKQAFIVAN